MGRRARTATGVRTRQRTQHRSLPTNPTLFLPILSFVCQWSQVAHSWTGNGVTAASWAHFWLNEGFTVLLERKILKAVRGEAAAALSAVSGGEALRAAVRGYGADHPFTALVPDLAGGVDPDDAFSKVPYEKGYAFLRVLEEAAGGEAAFEPWLRERWIRAWTGRAATSADLREAYCSAFDHVPAVAEIDWEAWLHAPGLPPRTVPTPSGLADAARALAARWAETAASSPPGAAASDVAGWPAEQVVYFLDALAAARADDPLAPEVAGALGSLYGFDTSPNCELTAAYLALALPAGHAPAIPAAVAFLGRQGRMKYVRPLFRALAAADGGAAAAAFRRWKAGYHPIAAKMVAADLALREGAGGEGQVATA